MPSVEMKRSTRVFGARVLRSGRRVWTESGDGKRMKKSSSHRDVWMDFIDENGDGRIDAILHKENGWADENNNDDGGNLKEKMVEIANVKTKNSVMRSSVSKNGRDRMWGTTYQRKRKRPRLSDNVDCSASCKRKTISEDKRFGKQFFRRQRRRKLRQNPSLFAVIERSCNGDSWFACFLNLVLGYMRRVRVRLSRLSAFLCSEPIVRVYSSRGIHFSRDYSSIKSSGFCKITGCTKFGPLFSVNFSAVPCCFMYMHTTLLLRSAFLPRDRVLSSEEIDMEEEEDIITLVEEQKSSIPSCIDNNNSKVSKLPVAVPKPSNNRTVHFRNGGVSNSRSIQKRRSSLRSRKGRNSSVFGLRKAKQALPKDPFGSKVQNGNGVSVSLTPLSSKRELRSSIRRASATKLKEIKSSLVGLTQDLDSTNCSANLLIIEPDKCYRKEGAIVKLESLASKQWILGVKIDGFRRYSLEPQKVMRPCCFNRFTQSIIWIWNDGLRLEFPNRRDWLIFKELYRECSDRNSLLPQDSFIPVPGVVEVSGYGDDRDVVFQRPDSYIRVNFNEVTRALMKKSPIYDMDCDDEEWLKGYNDEFGGGEGVSIESFEMMIDGFERGWYCDPDDYGDERVAVERCLSLERREVVEAVYGYWMKKRKQKRSSLIRIFQVYQPKGPQLNAKSILRKKRSFKRQSSHFGRAKHRTFLQAPVVAEQDDADEEENRKRVEEKKAAACRSEELAVLKRQRAQLLMENADLATYKANMALRIAEAAQFAESSQHDLSSFFSPLN